MPRRTATRAARRHGGQAAQPSDGLLQEILQNVPQAIAVLGRDRRVKFGNSSFERMTAGLVAPGGLDGLRLEPLLCAIGVSADLAGGIARAAALPCQCETTSAANRPLRVRLLPTRSNHLLLSISDLAPQRREEADRLAQRERVLHAERDHAVVTFAGSIAHDFNNVLAVILGFSALAAGRLGALSNALAGAHPEAAGESRAIAATIDDIIASANQGREIVASLTRRTCKEGAERRIVDLRQTVWRSEHLLRVLFPATARLVVKTGSVPCCARVNEVQVEQIITNLCINGVHALEGRTGQVTLAIDLVDVGETGCPPTPSFDSGTDHDDDQPRIPPESMVDRIVGTLGRGRHIGLSVTDDGVGMHPDVAEQLFIPFFTTKGPDRGTGLGLSSVWGIVETYGGAIRVRTQRAVGSVVQVFLPAPAGLVPE